MKNRVYTEHGTIGKGHPFLPQEQPSQAPHPRKSEGSRGSVSGHSTTRNILSGLDRMLQAHQ